MKNLRWIGLTVVAFAVGFLLIEWLNRNFSPQQLELELELEIKQTLEEEEKKEAEERSPATTEEVVTEVKNDRSEDGTAEEENRTNSEKKNEEEKNKENKEEKKNDDISKIRSTTIVTATITASETKQPSSTTIDNKESYKKVTKNSRSSSSVTVSVVDRDVNDETEAQQQHRSYRSCSLHELNVEHEALESLLASDCGIDFSHHSHRGLEGGVEVSVIIPTHNNAQMTYDLFRSLLAQNWSTATSSSSSPSSSMTRRRGIPSFEVLIFDDVSVDETPELLKRLKGSNVRYHLNRGPNVFYAKANNHAIFNMSSPSSSYVWLLNNDVELWPGCFQALYDDISSSSKVCCCFHPLCYSPSSIYRSRYSLSNNQVNNNIESLDRSDWTQDGSPRR